MRSLPRHVVLVVGLSMAALATGCASGRVRGGQGTEMIQAEEYQPSKKVEPPQGNIDRVSGPIESPEPPPVLEVDLERRRPVPGPEPEPDPPPKPEPGREQE